MTSATRERLKSALRRTGLATPVRWMRYWMEFVQSPAFRRLELGARHDFAEWKRENGSLLRPRLTPPAGSLKTALIVGKGTIVGAKIELGLIKGLELAGFEPVVLTERRFVKYYRLAGVSRFVFWNDFLNRAIPTPSADVVGRARSVDELLSFEHAGTRVGKFAISTTMRALRAGDIDLSVDSTRTLLAANVGTGMMHAVAAQDILRTVAPGVVLFMDNRYTGQGELLDLSLNSGVSVITWFEAHRSNTLMFKRYSRNNRDQHHASLSDDSWRMMLEMPWTEERRQELHREFYENYESGDWYSRGGTQVDKSILSAPVIRERLGLDPDKKTAVIFPHVIWDATLFWGQDLFRNYEEWLVETVRAACANTHVNWAIKIHPVHVAKNAMERYTGEVAEVTSIKRAVGPLPPHVHLIPSTTDINTFSLFTVMDYCVTVRGTIGIESASHGIPVLTGGSGRYDRRGFTVDSETREEYLHRLAHIQDIGPLSATERELAERFAYGAFMLRPFPLKVMSIQYERDIEATTKVTMNAKSPDELRHSPDLIAFADWVARSTQADYLQPLPAAGQPLTSAHRQADSERLLV